MMITTGDITTMGIRIVITGSLNVIINLKTISIMYSQCNAAGSRPAFEKYGHFAHHGFRRAPWGMGFRRPKYNVPVNIIDSPGNYEVHVYAVSFDKENI